MWIKDFKKWNKIPSKSWAKQTTELFFSINKYNCYNGHESFGILCLALMLSFGLAHYPSSKGGGMGSQ